MFTAAAPALSTPAARPPKPACDRMVGRNPTTASHCPEYRKNARATSQGPGAASVRRTRGPRGAPCPASAMSGGRPRHSATSASSEHAVRPSHTARHPSHSITGAPSSSASAVPRGI